jgi:predicted ester cyclase
MLLKLNIILIALVFVLAAPAVHAQESRKEASRAIMSELYDNGNIAVVATQFAPDFVRHPGEAGPDALKIAVLALRAAMPDLKTQVEWLIEQENQVALRLWLRGTFTHEYVAPDALPVPPTGQPVEMVVNIVLRFNEAEQIAEEWDGFDNLRFYNQLGLLSLNPSRLPAMQYPDVVDVGMSAQNRQVIQGFFDAYNQANWGYLDTYFKSDFSSHGPFGTLNRADTAADLNRLRAALPDLVASVDGLVTEGNWTAAVYSLRGTFSNNFSAGNVVTQPTGKPLELLMITFYRFDEQGLVAEAFELYDSFSFMTQLGLLALTVFPTPTPGG